MLYEKWLNSKAIDEEDKKIMLEMSSEEIKENFCKNLSFGTGGIRAKMGLGTNRLNKYVIRKITQGLANYLIKNKDISGGVVIARDSRINSLLFQNEAAKVLSSNGIKVFVYDEVHSTPEMSFAVIKLKASAGIVITASHNSKEYNGYKVYLEDGGQVVSPYVDSIIEEIDKVELEDVKYTNDNLVEVLDKSIDDSYIEEIKKLSKIEETNLNIVYSPLHGTGGRPVYRVLKEVGFNVKLVESQFEPNGNFPTIAYANPEVKESFDEALKYMDKDTDILLNNDPDSDRLGLAVVYKNKVHYLNGNETGMLILDYLINTREYTKDSIIATTIVSTPMVDSIKNMKVIKTLTGFKYIGEIIKYNEDDFFFGFEESFGFLYKSNTRDKDGILASLLVAEMAVYYKNRGKNLIEILKNIEKKYGKYYSDIINIALDEESGMQKVNNFINKLKELNVNKIDYSKDATGLPKAKVLELNYEDGTKILVRPSGTEPKLKIYIYARSLEKIEEAKEKLTRYIN